MLVKDESKILEHARRQVLEQKFEDVRRWIAEQTETAMYIGTDMDPSNAQRQIGQEMTGDVFERKLRPLVSPNILFLSGPKNSEFKGIYRRHPDGKKELLTVYHRNKMPEHSLLAQAEEEVPEDMSRLDPSSSGHIKRGDLPKAKWNGEKWIFEGGTTPGLKKVRILWHERHRGWRTVLLRLVKHGVITPSQAEGVFGSDNRPEWAGHTGKQLVTTPW